MISLDKCGRSCNVLSPTICIPKVNPKDINVKASDMITKKMKLKKCQIIFRVIVNANSIVQHLIQIKNGITRHINASVKINTYAIKSLV